VSAATVEPQHHSTFLPNSPRWVFWLQLDERIETAAAEPPTPVDEEPLVEEEPVGQGQPIPQLTTAFTPAPPSWRS
jgi:hypothetical protein